MTTYPWSDFEPTRTDALEEYTAAKREVEQKKYSQAAKRLEWILSQPTQEVHAMANVRELLALSYFHSAQLRKAEEAARAILSDNPHDGYASMILGRALERQNRMDEAKAPLALARAMGVEDA